MSRPELLPTALPPELAAFLQDHLFACLTHPTDQGTVLLLKAPRQEIEMLRGPLPIAVHHALHDQVTAPVIRMVVTFYDQPSRPLAFETFINVQDPQQRADYAALADQPDLRLLCYDEDLAHRLTKRVTHRARARVPAILARADALWHAIPEDEF